MYESSNIKKRTGDYPIGNRVSFDGTGAPPPNLAELRPAPSAPAIPDKNILRNDRAVPPPSRASETTLGESADKYRASMKEAIAKRDAQRNRIPAPSGIPAGTAVDAYAARQRAQGAAPSRSGAEPPKSKQPAHTNIIPPHTSKAPVRPVVQAVERRAVASRPLASRSGANQAALARPLRTAVKSAERFSRPVSRPIDQYNWLRLILISFICIAMLTAAIYFFFQNTDQGQFMLASWNRAASGSAYAALGRQRLEEGLVRDAVHALEIARGLEPDDLSILLDLGEAYEANAKDELADLAYRRAIQLNPTNSAPYRRIIRLYEESGRAWESLALMELALEKTGDESFSTMLREARPDYPRVSVIGGYYADAFTLTLTATDPEAEIRYTLDGSDPYLGNIYENGIFLADSESEYNLRAIALIEGRASYEQKQTYIIRSAAPDMPKANLQPGTYPSVRTVGLRAGSDVAAIYYTTDNSPATTASKEYTGTPIVLRKGKTTLRAIALGANDKISNEMNIVYVCGGDVKNSLLEKDTFDGMALFKTTRAQFESKYGAPQSEAPGGYDSQGSYTAAYYPFGHAVYQNADDPQQSTLAELSTTDPAMIGPRGVHVNMTLPDALALFRDEGGEDDINGNRVLYKLATGNLGQLIRTGDSTYEAHYYTKLEYDFIELALYSDHDVIVKIEWLRYRAQE